MSETPRYEPPENPASSSIARVRLRAQLIGQQTADELRAVLNSMEFRIGSWDVAPGNARRKAEADELHAHALLTDDQHEQMAKPREYSGGRGVTITM